MNRGPGIFALFVELATNVVIDVWERAHRVRVKAQNFYRIT